MAWLTSISYLEVNKSKGAWKWEVAKGSRRLSASLRWNWRCAAPSKEACYHGLRWREEREVEREREEWQGAIYNWQPSSLPSWSWRGFNCFNCFIDKQTNKENSRKIKCLVNTGEMKNALHFTRTTLICKRSLHGLCWQSSWEKKKQFC